jgi:Trk K+ transport system NAD-binding subunit
VLIVHGEENITPSGDTIFRPEDRIFALVTLDGERALRELILNEAMSPTPSAQ